jgi:hypothetical protein
VLQVCDAARSCDCPDCRKAVLRHAEQVLPRALRDAVAYAVEKYSGLGIVRKEAP